MQSLNQLGFDKMLAEKELEQIVVKLQSLSNDVFEKIPVTEEQ